jgi:hypothetical protein
MESSAMQVALDKAGDPTSTKVATTSSLLAEERFGYLE